MSELATFMRITGLQVSNEDVDSRKAAVAQLKASWGKIKGARDIIAKAAEVAAALGGDGIPSTALAEEIQAAIQKKASAFLYTERPLDIGVVAGATLSELVSDRPGLTGWLIVDVFAIATWSALAFQQPLVDGKREELRTFVLEKCRKRTLEGAEAARQRVPIPDFSALSVTAGEEDKFSDRFKKATSATIEALRRNAALDREELDFLWWTQLDRSRLVNRRFSSLSEPARAVTAGIEAATHLRRFPSDAHRDVSLARISNDGTLTLSQLLNECHDFREELVKGLLVDPSFAPSVYPLLHSLKTGQADIVGGDIARPVSEWGGRALLEAALIKFQDTGPSSL